ncbi:MAG: alpha-hydroxy-acid oxidizing protein, partial [Clostridium sp.]|nr:alpha-hydroxy-acid oxidizing protein [Clostridium sp.]
MDYKELLKEARENLNGSCKVCKACNGVACAGEVPGMGGKGSGSAFTENFKSLQDVKINMRVIHNVSNPDTSVELFGKKMKAPIFAAPVTGTTLNMGGKISEREYITPVVEGCIESGIYPMVGDTAVDSFLMDNLDVLKENNGEGIVFIKPWENHDIIKKIKLAEEAGAYAVGVDIDACGLVTLSMHGKKVVPKDVEALKELKASTKLPFIVKGIMTVEDAMLAVEAGVDAIVVSNHGGRVLDCTPGAADVLPAIAKAVKGKVTILADGGVRSGVDVLKMIGLGADGVLIGRPFVTASFGGAKEGVKLYVDKL